MLPVTLFKVHFTALNQLRAALVDWIVENAHISLQISVQCPLETAFRK